jgi:hypothetical protein
MRRLPWLMITVMLGATWAPGAESESAGTCELVPSAQTDQQHNPARSTHELYGKITVVKGERFTLQPRTGRLVEVDATDALRAHLTAPLIVGRAVLVRGDYDAKGVLYAQAILRAKDSETLWPADR